MQNVLKLGTAALGVSLLFAIPVFAEEGETNTDDTQATAESNANDRICRRIRTTGTRLTQRVCMSRAEWADLREESQETLRQNDRDTGVNTSTVGSN